MNERIPDQEKLRRDLEDLLGSPSGPPEGLKASVLEYAARRRRRAPAPRWRIPAAAATLVAAAALVILVTRPDAPRPELEAGRLADAPALSAPTSETPMEMQKSVVAERRAMRAAPVEGDLNGDGRVNILDAFRLARSIESGQGQVDLDADGEVSPDDLDRLMRQIVAVRGGAS